MTKLNKKIIIIKKLLDDNTMLTNRVFKLEDKIKNLEVQNNN